ncbi:MAG: hypothetical protein K2X37_05460, partial [Chitinophagaceae bacterium]|nr:hypothetical protein [Chitinophagaceae bacterium]
MKKFFSLSLIAIFISTVLLSQGTMLLRQPSASKSHIVFVHGDDLWVVDRNGGDAYRLTSAIGAETNPRISPDGNWVAFTAQYDGNNDVFIVPIKGGTPKRLTWHPGNDLVQCWTPDNKSVIFTSGREGYPTANTKFFKVSVNGGTPESVGIPFGFAGSISEDAQFMAYQPHSFWDPEWRNYRGGQAQPIWIYNLKTKETTKTVQGDRERHTAPAWVNGIL